MKKKNKERQIIKENYVLKQEISLAIIIKKKSYSVVIIKAKTVNYSEIEIDQKQQQKREKTTDYYSKT